MRKYKLSIIIPVYNAEKYLERTLLSILNQINQEMEIILVNDGSTDSSEIICKKFCEKSNSIHYIYKNNEGVSRARNVGIEEASGEWIMFLDADDLIQPNVLEKLDVNKLNTDIIIFDYAREIVKCNQGTIEYVKIESDKLKNCILNYSKYSKQIQREGYKIDSINNWTCWGKIFKRDFILDNNIRFPVGITHGEDLLFCYKAYLKTEKEVIYIPIFLYYYRINEDSVSRNFNIDRMENTRNIFQYFLDIDKNIKYNDDFWWFITERTMASLYLFYGNKENVMSLNEKIDSLKEFVGIEYINYALRNCNSRILAIGKKRNFEYRVLLALVNKKRYKIAIYLSKVIGFTN